jgi:hypothetical protein
MLPTPSAALLVIAAGVHPLLAGFKQLAAGLGQGRALVQVADELEDVLAPQTSGGWRLEIAGRGDTVGSHEGIGAPPPVPPPPCRGEA